MEIEPVTSCDPFWCLPYWANLTSAVFNFTFDYTRILQVSVLQAMPSLLNKKAWECNILCSKLLGPQVQSPLKVTLLCWICFALPYTSLYCQLCIIKGKLENGHMCLQQVRMFLVNLIKTIRSTWYGKVICEFSFVRIKLFQIKHITDYKFPFVPEIIQYFVNVFNPMTKIFILTVKILFEPTTSDVRDQSVTTEPMTRCIMHQWFISFPEFAEFTEFPFHVWKIPLWTFVVVKYIVMSQGLLGLCCSIETRDCIERITLTAVFVRVAAWAFIAQISCHRC